MCIRDRIRAKENGFTADKLRGVIYDGVKVIKEDGWDVRDEPLDLSVQTFYV